MQSIAAREPVSANIIRYVVIEKLVVLLSCGVVVARLIYCAVVPEHRGKSTIRALDFNAQMARLLAELFTERLLWYFACYVQCAMAFYVSCIIK